jgi:GntR family transcriptional regulator
MINFSINFRPGIPIYEQVVYAVKKAIVSGQLREGDGFPSVRELSRELRINPNTAQKIIANLVAANLLEIKPGIGSIVSKLSKATEAQRHEILETEVEKLVIESKRFSIKKTELTEAIERHWGADRREK